MRINYPKFQSVIKDMQSRIKMESNNSGHDVEDNTFTKCPGKDAPCPFRLVPDEYKEKYKCWNGHIISRFELMNLKLYGKRNNV